MAASGSDTESMFHQVRQWSKAARDFATPSHRRSVLQLVATVVPWIGLWIAMALTVETAYWATLLLAVPAALFTVRLFILQHDCGHRSFFRSDKANDWVGAVLGVVTLTPHGYWRKAHNIHHATCGDLDRRGVGDITTLTVQEYRALPPMKRLAYRVYRNPLVILVIGPVYVFVVKYRLPLDLLGRYRRLLPGVLMTNAVIAALAAGLSYAIGFVEFLMIAGPVVYLSSAAGVWLFYVQHQFEETYWRDRDGWDFQEAAVLASSYYDLPKLLHWFTGHIGLHHIHHLAAGIPNYRLPACLKAIPALKDVNRIGLRESLSCLKLALWDEAEKRLVPFSAVRAVAA